MGKEYQEPLPTLSELQEKADALEKLSAQRLALSKRVGIAGKVQAHTSLKTAEKVGRVRSKLELSGEIYRLRAIGLREELEAYAKAPGIMLEWQRRGEEFTALNAEHYRGKVGKTKFTKAYREYKVYVDRIERHLPTMCAIKRRRQEAGERSREPID
ncbi:MAG: hypothetical protein JO266_06900 [Acidobacteria bacterium]|nr:hypothetical protein [Acidobacteriota bacterium]MBV9483180.1 hypothetical protein [Acidobacteriota bacterium]